MGAERIDPLLVSRDEEVIALVERAAEMAREQEAAAQDATRAAYVAKTGYVYFIGSQHSEMIKIGHALNPNTRLSELQTGSPVRLEIIATVVAPREVERGLHRAFERERRHGEWFIASERLRSLIDACKTSVAEDVVRQAAAPVAMTVMVNIPGVTVLRLQRLTSGQRTKIASHIKRRCDPPVGVSSEAFDGACDALAALLESIELHGYMENERNER